VNNSKKRLALFLPGLYGGGAERIVLNLAAGLGEQGYAVDLILAQAEGPYLDQVPGSVRLVGLNTRRRRVLRTLGCLPALVRYLRQDRPDALLSGLHANIVALWARRLAGLPKRVVITEHNTFSFQNQQLPGWYSELMFRLVRLFYTWADGIVAVSEGVADDLAQVTGIPRGRIQVIYNPIVTPELEVKTKEALKHLWFEPGEPPVVLAVGRLTEQKDFGTLIQAFARVRRVRAARLLILGEGEDRTELEALVRRLDLEEDVKLLGFVPNPYPYMAKASLFVLSSRWEGLPTVLVEALYCGAHIVATECPSGPREILRGGQYGRLVPVGDVASLAEAVETSLDNTTARSPCESWQPFKLETVINQYKKILLGV
jgi:glycosyltransferase involved in cell wall biosynthesis